MVDKVQSKDDLTFKQKLHFEREKLKDMTFKDKAWYIWEYYKIHMLAVALVVFLIYTVVYTIISTSYETVCYFALINDSYESDATDYLKENFADYIDMNSKEQKLVVESSLTVDLSDNSSEYSYTCMQKISALFAAAELDVMVCPDDIAANYASGQTLLDLTTIIPDDLMAQVSDYIVYLPGEDGTEGAYAIDISTSSFAEHTDIVNPYICIIGNSTRTDNALNFIRFVFDIPLE